MQEEIRPTIKTERWHRQPSMHRYPTQFKALTIQAIMVSELGITIGKPNHGRVYHLSDRATQQYTNAILNPTTRNMVEYRHLIAEPTTREVWEKSVFNEFGRLMKGLKRGTQGTYTMQLIQKHEVPHDKKVTYTRFVCDYRPQK